MSSERAPSRSRVKASTGIKDYHHDDIAVQAFVARAAVGHTPDVYVREKMKPKTRNYGLDVGNGSVAAVLVDGELEILN